MNDIVLLKHTFPTGAKTKFREISKENMNVDIIP